MKFGDALNEGLVAEWQDQYVNYKEGKKLIKKVRKLKDEYDDEINNYEQNTAAVDNVATRLPTNTTTNDARTPLLTLRNALQGGYTQENFCNDNERGEPEANRGKQDIQKSQITQQQHLDYDHDHTNTNTNTNNNNNSNTDPYIRDSQSRVLRELASFQRRPSIFNYSLKSSRADYFSEKKKFLKWLDEQLLKVDEFYSEKEQDVYERFLLLQDQLYQLRDQRTQLIRQRNRHENKVHLTDVTTGRGVAGKRDHQMSNKVNDLAFHTKTYLSGLRKYELPSLPSMRFLKKWRYRRYGGGKQSKGDEDDISLHIQDESDLNYAENRVRNGIVDLSDKNSEEHSSTYYSESDIEETLLSAADPGATTTGTGTMQHPQTEGQIRQTRRRDYTVKKQHFGVPYLYARKQLKTALLENYRSLSILRSYKTMNRTAFRKITKKFDKAMGTQVMEHFMERIDTTAYFLTSDLLDKLVNHVEELYITFFDPESKDRKHSLEKLKTIAYTINATDMKPATFYAATFNSALFLGFGLPLFVLALYTALHKTLSGELSEGRYLLQIWGGFLMLTLAFLLFAINMAVFEMFRINYKFIFEFNLATALNYKQFLLLPSFAFGLLGLIGWFSFQDFWPYHFPGRDWPWLFFGIMLAIFLWPGNQFYGASRRWLQFAIWRLILSGFYPVEFRDFFLGDIVCSLTYTMGNMSFFFCLYAHSWSGTLRGQDPIRNTCTSSRSRLMGFFSALPSVWRLLQCIRRYMDTGDWFPHLANMTKYTCSTIYYMTLSIYRIDNSVRNRAVFIVFASINSIYCSIWDIVMDWSLLQSGSKYFLLRDYLFYKNPYYYYAAMVIDVILRFQWIFYAFFSHQIQQSAVTSFCVALAEILRRFIWVFFRMENEHATNVILFRASKETPLPYAVSAKVEKAVKKLVELRYNAKKYQDESAEPEEQQNSGSVAEESVGFTTGRAETRGSRTNAAANEGINDGFNVGSNVGSNGGVDESSIDLARVPLPPPGPQLQQRKTYFKQITDRLNTAHIKDFQRRKTAVHMDEDSDDEDDDDASVLGRLNSQTLRAQTD